LKVEDELEEEDDDDVTETPAAVAEDPLMEESEEAQLLTKLSAQQIRVVLEDVCTEMLSGLEVCALKLFDAHCCHMGTALKHPVPDRHL